MLISSEIRRGVISLCVGSCLCMVSVSSHGQAFADSTAANFFQTDTPSQAAPKAPTQPVSPYIPQIITGITGMSTSLKACSTGTVTPPPDAKLSSLYATLERLGTKLTADAQSCASSFGGASFVCLETQNPYYAGILNTINTASGVIGVATASKARCDSFANAVKKVNMTIGLWQGACVSTRLVCMGTCGSGVADLTKIHETLVQMNVSVEARRLALDTAGTTHPCPTCATADISCKALQEQISTLYTPVNAEAGKAAAGKAVEYSSGAEAGAAATKLVAATVTVAERAESCNRYQAQLTSLGAALVNNWKANQGADECGENTAGLNGIDCSDEKNAQLPNCICMSHPENPACRNQAASLKSGGLVQTKIDDGLGGDASMAPPGLGDDKDAAFPGAGAAGGPGMPTGGGAGIDGGGGGGGRNGDTASGRKGLNANILSGFGGGGGGAGGGVKYQEAEESEAAKQLRKHMPASVGGLSGQSLFGKEVTGQGKSNWDKVRERYSDNTSSLIGN